MPWRDTRDPYRILLSEVMLQQTQVSRVLVKYPEFLRAFPTIRALAHADKKKLLRMWQGMGYNRRALYLKRAAQTIIKQHEGHVPKTLSELESLPGIGHATAAAILTYAFNKPAPFIETNTRRVFIHHFFPKRRRVSDADIMPLIGAALPKTNRREWYYALMDYGTFLARAIPNPNKRSLHYARQQPFEGSTREIRGFLLKESLAGRKIPIQSAAERFNRRSKEIRDIIKKLKVEDLL